MEGVSTYHSHVLRSFQAAVQERTIRSKLDWQCQDKKPADQSLTMTCIAVLSE